MADGSTLYTTLMSLTKKERGKISYVLEDINNVEINWQYKDNTA